MNDDAEKQNMLTFNDNNSTYYLCSRRLVISKCVST